MHAARGLLAVALGLAAALTAAAPASAAPAMCTVGGPPDFAITYVTDVEGIEATHLYANTGTGWFEPQDLCVRVTIERGQYAGLYVGLTRTDGQGAFTETNLPPGTRVSVGLRRPSGVVFLSGFAGGRGGVMVSDSEQTVFQSETARWEYYEDAFFGSGLDCTKEPTVWPSTFLVYVSIDPLYPGDEPDLTARKFAGAFYESNNHGGVSYPQVNFGPDGLPTSIVLRVQGCGDDDPSTFEGYMNGFVPLSYFEAFGMDKHLMRDIKLLQDLLEVRDLNTGDPVEARFEPVRPDDLGLASIPGVVMPSLVGGNDYNGVRLESRFSYSERVLQYRARPSAVTAVRACRERGRTPAADHGRLACLPRLAAAKTLRRGDRIAVFCAGRCTVGANVVAAGTRLATGRGRRGDAGKVSVRLRMTAAGLRLLAARRPLRAKLVVTVLGGGAERTRIGRRVKLAR